MAQLLPFFAKNPLKARGFGRLEIVIEHNRLRRMVPHRFIPYPGSQVRYYPSSLPDDILGPWGVEVAGGLAEVMASGFGSVTILVEHARIAGIDVAPSVSSVP